MSAAAARSEPAFATVERAIEEIKRGRPVIVCDGTGPENECDLAMAAQFATPEAVNFMAREARGLVSLALTPERCDELGLRPMGRREPSGSLATGRAQTAFTVSIEAREGVTTGISVHDRARTIQVAINPANGPDAIVMPGHVFPLRGKNGGVLERSGHTEAAIDLARMAGLAPAGVLCEILGEDGLASQVGGLGRYAKRHGLLIVSVADLIAHRHRTEVLVERVAAARLPTDLGEFTLVGYRSLADGKEHTAAVHGDLTSVESPLVRVHSECMTSEVFGSRRCDCAQQLRRSMELIVEEGAGAVVYLAQEGRGIGILNKLRAYELQDREQLDTVDANLALGFAADLRDFGVGAQILADLGLGSMRLLTNNPKKIIGLEGHGLTVAAQVPLVVEPHAESESYLMAKANRMGHDLGLVAG